MGIERILLAIISIFFMGVAAPVAFFYLRPRYKRFHGEALKDESNQFFRLVAGPMAARAGTERGWRISLSVVALTGLVAGCAGLYVAFFYSP